MENMENEVSSRKKKVLAPGEMEQIVLKKIDLEQIEDLRDITVAVRQKEEKIHG